MMIKMQRGRDHPSRWAKDKGGCVITEKERERANEKIYRGENEDTDRDIGRGRGKG